MPRSDFGRRDFIVSTALALLPATIPGLARARGKVVRTKAAAILSDIASAREIGRAYVAQAPAEGNLTVLATTLPEGCARPHFAPADTAALREEINRRRRRDFASGDTVLVDGWILARTEARLCAFLALLPLAPEDAYV